MIFVFYSFKNENENENLRIAKELRFSHWNVVAKLASFENGNENLLLHWGEKTVIARKCGESIIWTSYMLIRKRKNFEKHN